MDNKAKIAGRITESRKAVGITIKELSARIGSLSAARISNWEQGTRSPGPVEAKLLAEQLQVSASYLLGLTDSVHGELSQASGKGPRFIPVLDMNEAHIAKDLLQGGMSPEKTIAVDGFNRSHGSEALFAAIIEDASMQPEFKPGDVVVIDTGLVPKPGDYVVAHLAAKKHNALRKYGEADGCLYQLLASNELWATVSVKPGEDVVVVGVVVEHRRFL